MEELQQQINDLQQAVNLLRSYTSIPFDTGEAFRIRLGVPSKMEKAPVTALTSPTLGSPIDSEARTAIDAIISALEELGLVLEN